MTLIEPIKQKQGTSKTKRYSVSLRFWHWLNTMVITALLITVLINSTILKSRQIAPAVQSEMQKKGKAITIDQARNAVHVLSDKIWDLHVYLGYGLAALFLFRLIAEFFELTDRKFINRMRKAWQQFNSIQQQRAIAKRELVVKAIYIAFYLLLLIMVATGLCLAFHDDLPFSKAVVHSIKEIHGFCMYLILAFIIVHLLGVLLAERKDGKGIVSDMINGG